MINSFKKKMLLTKRYFIQKPKGTLNKPRIVIFRSNKHIYAQLIDDLTQVTILSYSTVTKDFQNKFIASQNKNAAFIVGEEFGKKLLSHNIKVAFLDTKRYIYHGRIKSITDGIRRQGISC